jgi:hypothetical protein
LVDSTESVRLVREQLRQFPEAEGVVLIGGYDTVPAQRRDALPAQLRQQVAQQVGEGYDEDNFTVWNDDVYGDRGDGTFIPVSRIPDGKDRDLVFGAIQANDVGQGALRYGVRNVLRPFAGSIFSNLPGNGGILLSEPTKFNQRNPELDLTAQRIYLMLHGHYDDAKLFWGEKADRSGYIEAVHTVKVPKKYSGVVFAGCCWGALCSGQPAFEVRPGAQPTTRVAEASIALSFLKAGAKAFVGCTGVHYSPDGNRTDYYGGPMHGAFWRNIVGGQPPAAALFNAKGEYRTGIPHRLRDAVDRAIELKILQQFTCLGLGW